MKNKSFITYPRTKIGFDNPNIQVIDAPIKVRLKSFITGYLEDRNELPSASYIQSIFGISEHDAEMALHFYGDSK
ncbi:hypothetical protein [Bacillus sp. FJAT-22090]|uniref:hypothetical protein n=1 Tax=Bacillus sp. FJAT-22090 TaxID=1581038 RepID=UPI0011A19FF6|nr:hypothetical protein [Bacillus sp. FJAT-22090]